MDIIEKAIEHYGHEHQTWKAVEEMGELTQAICKHQLAEDPLLKEVALLEVWDEIADVYIMMEQLKKIYGETVINDKIKFKLERLEKRMEMENNERIR